MFFLFNFSILPHLLLLVRGFASNWNVAISSEISPRQGTDKSIDRTFEIRIVAQCGNDKGHRKQIDRELYCTGWYTCLRSRGPPRIQDPPGIPWKRISRR